MPPPANQKYFSLGFNQALSDLLWLEFIQGESDCYFRNDDPHTYCSPKWGYGVLKEATDLDPRYKVLYVHGATQLSVLVDDHIGASKIFDKGVEAFPSDWLVHYRAAYVEMIELKNKEKAAGYLKKASDLGAPYWTRSLASKLYSETGEYELSYRTLFDLYKKADEGSYKKDLEKRLAKIKLALLESQTRRKKP